LNGDIRDLAAQRRFRPAVETYHSQQTATLGKVTREFDMVKSHQGRFAER
jgi:hypothetical protein